MKLTRRSIETPQGTVRRDEEGCFLLCDFNGECKKVEREEARLRMGRQGQTAKKNDNQFTYPSIGEQWIGHGEFFALGKAFIGIGRNELTRDWENVFRMSRLQLLAPISYNFLHGIELGLKAFLLHSDKRMLPIDLKESYGHNIKELLKDTARYGLDVERPIVIPDDAESGSQQIDKEDDLGVTTGENWIEDIFGKASRRDEQNFDIAIGISFERYAQKGTEYPISVFENHGDAYLASVAGLAYTLFEKIRDADDFLDQRQRRQHMEFEGWLEELHSARRNYRLTLHEAAEQLKIYSREGTDSPRQDQPPRLLTQGQEPDRPGQSARTRRSRREDHREPGGRP